MHKSHCETVPYCFNHRLVSAVTPGSNQHIWYQPYDLDSATCLFSNLDLISVLFQSSHLVCVFKIGFCHHTWFQPFDIFSTLEWFQSPHMHLVSTIAPSFTSHICFHRKAGHQWYKTFRSLQIPRYRRSRLPIRGVLY